ncbi:MAG TPA: SGNH/GDSL hydrolase family protein [Ktedonobacterales bacterium]
MMPESSRAGVGALVRDRRLQVTVACVILVSLLAMLVSFLHERASAGTVSVPVGQHIQPSTNGPLVSRGKPVVCSKSNAEVPGPNAITSGVYGQWSFWGSPDSELPSWCSIHIGVGPSRLMVVWYSEYDEDNAQWASNGRMPQSYTLSVSANSTDGHNGDWKVVTTVTGNPVHIRESAIPFAGQAWVRMTITQAQDHPTQDSMLIDQIDCWDISTPALAKNTVLFEGDSITALAFDHSTDPETFDALIHGYDARLFPSMLNEGMGGWASGGATNNIDKWLAINPDINYWLIEWGTNDAFAMEDPAVFRSNMQIVINKIKAAGHVPVLARIPPVIYVGSGQAQLTAEIEAINQQIDALTLANHLISGPDLYAVIGKDPQGLLQKDGIHPNGNGKKAINNAWYLAMRNVLRANLS